MGGLREAIEAVLEEGIVVAEEQDRNFGLPPEPRGHLQRLGERHAGLERAPGGFLDDRAVGGGVGKRDAEFEDVDPGAAGGAEDFKARFRVRIAGGEIADEGFAFGGGEFLEGGGEAVHGVGGRVQGSG